jgi:hypothetical protein
MWPSTSTPTLPSNRHIGDAWNTEREAECMLKAAHLMNRERLPQLTLSQGKAFSHSSYNLLGMEATAYLHCQATPAIEIQLPMEAKSSI